jgi:uncharacterized membrane protein YuzA (DUF378 family)
MCCPIKWSAKLIAAIGAINWGLVAFLKFNVVEYIWRLTRIPYLNMITYGLIAVAGVVVILSLFCKDLVCKRKK